MLYVGRLLHYLVCESVCVSVCVSGSWLYILIGGK